MYEMSRPTSTSRPTSPQPIIGAQYLPDHPSLRSTQYTKVPTSLPKGLCIFHEGFLDHKNPPASIVSPA